MIKWTYKMKRLRWRSPYTHQGINSQQFRAWIFVGSNETWFTHKCFHIWFYASKNSAWKLSRSTGEVFGLGFKIFAYPCRSECIYSNCVVLLMAYSMAYSHNMRNFKINVFVPSSLFIRPGLLILKLHYDRGAKKRKVFRKRRSEGVKYMEMVCTFLCLEKNNHVLAMLPVVHGSEGQLVFRGQMLSTLAWNWKRTFCCNVPLLVCSHFFMGKCGNFRLAGWLSLPQPITRPVKLHPFPLQNML